MKSKNLVMVIVIVGICVCIITLILVNRDSCMSISMSYNAPHVQLGLFLSSLEQYRQDHGTYYDSFEHLAREQPGLSEDMVIGNVYVQPWTDYTYCLFVDGDKFQIHALPPWKCKWDDRYYYYLDETGKVRRELRRKATLESPVFIDYLKSQEK